MKEISKNSNQIANVGFTNCQNAVNKDSNCKGFNTRQTDFGSNSLSIRDVFQKQNKCSLILSFFIVMTALPAL